MKLEADGTVVGRSQNRIGGSSGASIMGKWNVNDQGRWCANVGTTGVGGTKYCRAVLKAGEKYYYVSGRGDNDSSPAVEFSVSK